MPTPFTHLHYAQRVYRDLALTYRAALDAGLNEFLLGSVVADGQGGAGLPRDATHFYTYDRPIEPMPFTVMLNRYPDLAAPADPLCRAYIAGYVFHLAMDAFWTLHMTGPYFGQADWGDRVQRFLMLHVMLVTMDERDHAALDPALAHAVGEAEPGDWLPFLPIAAVRGWQHLIHEQVKPGGTPLTYAVMAPRVGMEPDDLRALVRDSERIDRDLWPYVPRSLLADREDGMYSFARDTLCAYLANSG
jgi:hypothetical protein